MMDLASPANAIGDTIAPLFQEKAGKQNGNEGIKRA
jgi:hypothetical protein